jgi:hypothetical protein
MGGKKIRHSAIKRGQIKGRQSKPQACQSEQSMAPADQLRKQRVCVGKGYPVSEKKDRQVVRFHQRHRTR